MNQITAVNKRSWTGSNASEFDYKGAARAILPRLAASSSNSERLRRLDTDAADALRESGLARVLTPKQFGGFELSPSAHVWACAELSHACSAASWVLMVCVAHDYIIGRFPEECQRDVYEGDPDNLVAGALGPQGTIRRVAGGWRLTGRWQFGSGCDHSPWFILGAKVADPEPDGFLIYHVVLPRADIELDDTWHTLGMHGTGSKDLVVNDIFIPEHRAVPTYPTFMGLSTHAKSPLYRMPVYSGLPAMVAGSVLGMAERGLRSFIETTGTRKTAHGVSKAESAGIQQRVAESAAEIASARRLLEDMCERFDIAMAADVAPLPARDRIQFRWDAAYIVELCRRAIDRIFATSGAHGIYESNPLHRVYRDINTACHHAVVDFDMVSSLQGRMALLGDLGENLRAAPLA